jgi:3-hydroxy-9,10-secoandrosta-1,3,5(10)-triene-9,17-dione monooxygenase
VMNISAWFATRASWSAQQEILQGTLRPRLCGSLEPTRTIRAVKDGAIVSGRWDFTSGCWHSNWCICGIPILDADGKPTDSGWAFIPMDQLKIEDTWHAAGMKGTGSCVVVADEVFVPSYRLMSLRGEHVDEAWMTRHRPEPCDYWPLKPVLVLGLVRFSASQRARSKRSRRRLSCAVSSTPSMLANRTRRSCNIISPAQP